MRLDAATGDSWASTVSRDLLRQSGSEEADLDYFLICSFFVAYMLTVNVMLLNIVIAVLLEAFMVAAEEEKQRHSKEGHSSPVLL